MQTAATAHDTYGLLVVNNWGEGGAKSDTAGDNSAVTHLGLEECWIKVCYSFVTILFSGYHHVDILLVP